FMEELVAHIEILVRNLQKCMPFYAEVLDWDIGPVTADETSKYVTFGKDGKVGGLLREWPAATAESVWLYCPVRNMEKAIETALRLGGRVAQPMTTYASGSYARVSDPMGTIIGLCTA